MAMMKRGMVLLLVLSVMLAACGQPATTPTETPVPQASATPTARPTSAPTATPTRTPEPTFTPTPTPDPFENVTPATRVVVWHGLTTKSHVQALQELADDFSRTNPWGIQVELAATGSTSESLSKTKQAIAQGTPPDGVIAYPSSLAEYAQALVPLDTFISHPLYGFQTAGLHKYAGSEPPFDVYPMANYDFLSLRLGRRYWFMYYNASMLKELGFTAPPGTWDELLRHCKAAAEQQIRCLALVPDATVLETYIWSKGADLFDRDGNVTLGGQTGQEGLAFFQQLIKDGLAYYAGDDFAEQKDFGAQKVLFTFGTTASLSYYEKEVRGRFEWGVAPFPAASERPYPMIVGYGFSGGILAQKPEQQLATWLFLRYLQEPGPSAQWAAVTGYLPVWVEGWDVAMGQESVAAIPHMEQVHEALMVETSMVDARDEPAIAGWGMVRSILGKALKSLLEGQPAETVWEQTLNDARKSVRP